jgi:exopolysaccharide biosynthesis polyprenyl glycosylphosphotransferase
MAGPRPQLQLNERRWLLMLGDVMAVAAAVLIALRIWAWAGERNFSGGFLLQQILWFPFYIILWLLLANANDFYDLRIVANRSAAFRRLLLITLQMVLVYLVIFFVSGRDTLPRLFTLYYGVASFVLIWGWRSIYPALAGWASEPRRVLIVGTGWGTEVIAGAVQTEAYNEYRVVGIIGSEDEVGQVICGAEVIGTGGDLMPIVERDRVSELVLTATGELTGTTFQAVMDAYAAGINIVPMPILYERITGRVPVEHVDHQWAVVLPLDENAFFKPYSLLKRLLDVMLAMVGLVLLSPVMLLAALLVKLEDGGPVFYPQKRLGLNGKPFTIYKFRSMKPNAEYDTGPVFATPNDPRVTRIGRFMRRARIDELPQLINVLRGEMSLVGPRPERPEHVARLMNLIPFYRTRLVTRPGLTGWAQVRYQYGADDQDALVKLQYDLYYIRHKSLLLDVNILLRTVGKVLKMGGV